MTGAQREARAKEEGIPGKGQIWKDAVTSREVGKDERKDTTSPDFLWYFLLAESSWKPASKGAQEMPP